MKNLIIGLLVAGSWTACHSDNAGKQAVLRGGSNSAPANPIPAMSAFDRSVVLYLEVKDALSVDDEKLARSKSNQLLQAVKSIDINLLNTEGQKAFTAEEADLKENAEHISKSEIDHQRAHFEALSDGIYNLVQAIGAAQTLYLVECKLDKDLKLWLSNSIDHKNPYLGNSGSGCYQVREKIPAVKN